MDRAADVIENEKIKLARVREFLISGRIEHSARKRTNHGLNADQIAKLLRPNQTLK